MSDRETKRDPEKTGDRAEDAELVEDLDIKPDEEGEDVRGGAYSRFGASFSAEPGGVSGATR